MKGTLLVALVLLACVAGSFGHLCLLSPHQRGNASDLTKVGSHDCYGIHSPCNNRSQQASQPLKTNANVSIVFQKNQNHYWATEPGMFEINYQADGSTDWVNLKTIPDTNTPSGTMYTIDLFLNFKPAAHAILQAVYIAHGPVPHFYSCADVAFME